MKAFPSFDGTPIAYSDQGEGDALILIHGFAASTQENWIRSGWVSMLTRAKRRVVTLDLRGHGATPLPDEPAQRGIGAMARDVIALADHLTLKKPDLIGFSLGARVVLAVLAEASPRFLLGVLCGAGGRWLEPQTRDPDALAQALEAADDATIDDKMAAQFRAFAQGQGQNLSALAAIARALGQEGVKVRDMDLKAITNECLVIAGKSDELAGEPRALAAAMANAKGVSIPGCGHMDCTIQPMFKGAVMDFLAGVV